MFWRCKKPIAPLAPEPLRYVSATFETTERALLTFYPGHSVRTIRRKTNFDGHIVESLEEFKARVEKIRSRAESEWELLGRKEAK